MNYLYIVVQGHGDMQEQSKTKHTKPQLRGLAQQIIITNDCIDLELKRIPSQANTGVSKLSCIVSHRSTMVGVLTALLGRPNRRTITGSEPSAIYVRDEGRERPLSLVIVGRSCIDPAVCDRVRPTLPDIVDLVNREKLVRSRTRTVEVGVKSWRGLGFGLGEAARTEASLVHAVADAARLTGRGMRD
jgi:hypothetical protein